MTDDKDRQPIRDGRSVEARNMDELEDRREQLLTDQDNA